MSPRNVFVFRDNALVQCSTAGLYLQGEGSQPVVLHNVFLVCKCPAVYLETRVDALLALNEMQVNDVGVKLVNNKSVVFENTIQKSHDDGIKILCDSRSDPACPLVQQNYVEASTHNGIVVEGHKCFPDITANVIEANRKAGIRIMDNAQAHVGGSDPSDLSLKRTPAVAKDHLELYLSLFEEGIGSRSSDALLTFYEVLEATVEFKELIMQHINDPNIPKGNSIYSNYSQGILLEEGCSADINSNHLLKNIKANIALGGRRSGEQATRILYNQIEKSK